MDTDVPLTYVLPVLLDATPHLTLEFSSGRNHVEEASIELSNHGDEVIFDTQDASLCEGGTLWLLVVFVFSQEWSPETATVEFTSQTIILKDVQPKSSVRINVPYSGARLEYIKVRRSYHGSSFQFIDADPCARFTFESTTQRRRHPTYDAT